LPLVPILSQMIPIHILQPNVPKIHLSIIHPSIGGQDSSVSTVYDYGLDDWAIWV
jgi:hypothetical protein